jgi:hypothetical protein
MIVDDESERVHKFGRLTSRDVVGPNRVNQLMILSLPSPLLAQLQTFKSFSVAKSKPRYSLWDGFTRSD